MLHQIGAGVLGPVFRAYQPDPGRLVAVKQFRLDLAPDSAHRFVAQLDLLIAADLTHLGIAAPLAAGLTDSVPYLAQDFVAAESFDVVIRDYGPAPVTEALRLATQLGGALDFAAAVNVFHGALHPRDVLVSTDDTRVTGLGIAQALEQIASVPPVRRPYAAPERLAGGPWDRRADGFSLAAMVFEMLFGRRIAGAGSASADAMTPIEGTDMDDLRSLFAQALAEDPAERFETALGFADALHGAVSQPARPKSARGRRKRDDEEPARLRSVRAERPALPLDTPTSIPLTVAPQVRNTTLRHDIGEPLPPPSAGLPLTEEAEPDPRSSTAAHIEPLDRPVEPFARSVAPFHRPDVQSAAPAAETFEWPDATLPSGGFHHDVVDTPFDTPVDTPERESAFTDLDLRLAKPDRFAIAESAPSLPEPAPFDEEDPDGTSGEATEKSKTAEPTVVIAPPPLAAQALPLSGTLSEVALEEGRSAIWPLALALVVGLMVGFAFGYGAGSRDHGDAGSQASLAAAATETETTAGFAPSQPADPPASPQVPPSSVVAAPRNQSPAGPPPAVASPPPAVAPRPRPPTASPRQQVAPAARTGAADGRLLVRSSPAGARVIVDGRDAGVTPVAVSDLSPGVHVVRIAHQGYVAAERRVRIRSAQPAQPIEVELVATRAVRGAAPPPAAPERTSGSLMVDSRPAGARVFVDGNMVGTTPLLLDAVNAGDHGVRLELDGFNTWSTSTRIVGGERNRVSGSLEPR